MSEERLVEYLNTLIPTYEMYKMGMQLPDSENIAEVVYLVFKGIQLIEIFKHQHNAEEFVKDKKDLDIEAFIVKDTNRHQFADYYGKKEDGIE
jgi:hypothetical protein